MTFFMRRLFWRYFFKNF